MWISIYLPNKEPRYLSVHIFSRAIYSSHIHDGMHHYLTYDTLICIPIYFNNNNIGRDVYIPCMAFLCAYFSLI